MLEPTDAEIDAAFAVFACKGIGGLFCNNSFFLVGRRGRLAALALKYRLPSSRGAPRSPRPERPTMGRLSSKPITIAAKCSAAE